MAHNAMTLLGFVLLHFVPAVVGQVLDECRIERVDSYEDDGTVTHFHDEANQKHWVEEGFDVEEYDKWNTFKRGNEGEDAICSVLDPSKPYCISYFDPDHSFDLNGMQGFREKKICAECRPNFNDFEDFSCDCRADEYCSRQFPVFGDLLDREPPQEWDIRLDSGARLCEGRLEVYHNNEWGTVCDDGFYYTEAQVACAQLGFDNVNESEYLSTAAFGEGVGSIWMDDVRCIGNETRLADCDIEKDHNCEHREDVSVICGYCAQDLQTRLLEEGPRNIQLLQSMYERDYSWTKDHALCTAIPKEKIGSKCTDFLSGLVNTKEDLDVYQGQDLWCGDLSGWEGHCYQETCHECIPPYSNELDEDNVECISSKGQPRWCSSSGHLTTSMPKSPTEKKLIENDITGLAMIGVTMGLIFCILVAVCFGLKGPRMTKHGMERHIDHAEMTAP